MDVILKFFSRMSNINKKFIIISGTAGIVAWFTYYYRKQIFYNFGIAYKRMMCTMSTHHWFSYITDKLILGALPLHEYGHLQQLTNEKVGAILSIVEDFELKPFIFHPVNKTEWQEHTITYKQINVRDNTGLTNAEIKDGINFISNNINLGKKVYVHCKSGHGRSASVVLCYMLVNKYKDNVTGGNIIDTYKNLRELRKEVHLNNYQMKSICNFFDIPVILFD